jgi:hypothetical protein
VNLVLITLLRLNTEIDELTKKLTQETSDKQTLEDVVVSLKNEVTVLREQYDA